MTVATSNSRYRLNAIRDRTSTARARRNRARQQLDAARAAGDEDARLLAESLIDDISIELETSEALEKQALSLMAGVDGIRPSTSFLDDPAVIEELRQLAHSSAPIGAMNLGQVMSREEWCSRYASSVADMDPRSPRMAATGLDPNIPETGLSRLGEYQGVVPQLRRKLTILDLIPTSTMEGNSFAYTQESGVLDSAAETAELSVKPQGNVAFTDVVAVARTIAAWHKLARQQISDVPLLSTTIYSRLVYYVNRRLESEILAGDGQGEDLLGILNTTGIGAPASVSGDTCNADLILNGIGAVVDSSATPTAVVMYPDDLNKMLKNKASTSGLRLDSDGAFAQPMDTIWGVPIVTNLAMTPGTALVGDWVLGATLYVREGVNVRTSDADQDDFLRNRLTMLGEGRFALAVWRPACWAKVELTFPA